jgi:hypothetical protein
MKGQTMKKMCCLAALAVTGVLSLLGATGRASAQCTSYTVTTLGGPIDPGTLDIGNHCDDCTTAIPGGMPFAWNFYGNPIAAGSLVGACSNGFLTFGSTAISSFSNQCLASSSMGATLSMMPFWDDQLTNDLGTAVGRGIFTSVNGVAPNRVFNIEWRAREYNDTNAFNYEIRIYEGQTYFDFVYGAMSVPGSATVGVQKDFGTAVFTSVNCNAAAVIPAGTVYHFDCPPTTPPTGVGSANPALVANDGLETTLLSVLVTPGTGPASTAHAVTGDLSSIGGVPGQVFYDDGTHGDLVAGDLRFSFRTTVIPGTPAGPHLIPFTVQETAPLARSSTGNITVTVATGTCCTAAAGCQVLTASDCAALGGVRGADGSTCTNCSCLPPIPNDDCVGALPAALGPNPFDSTCATTSVPAATCGSLGSDLWYSYTPPFNGVLTVSTCGFTAADTAVAIYSDCNTSIACNDDFCATQSSVSTCVVTAGTTYLLRIGGFAGTHWVGSFNVALSPPPVDETGQLPATAVLATAPTIVGVLSDCPANDVDMYIIHICSPPNFTATVNPVGTTISDTQLFLFRMDGTGVAMNDDDPLGVNGTLSRLNGPIVQGIPAGDYLLAISVYDNDPIDAAALAIWADTPYNTVRAPDGPGALSAIADWDNNSFVSGGTYVIDLTGTMDVPCGPGPCCRNDFNGDGDVGTDQDIEDFFACLAGNCCATCPPNADFNCDGDVGTDADIGAFFSVLGGGPC